MFKKLTLIALALLLAVLPAAGLAETAEETVAPEEEAVVLDADYPVFEWQRDAKEHWRVLESGEKTDVGAHEVPEDEIACSVCGSEIWIFEDGCADVSNYNEYYELVWATSYEADGSIAYENVFAYEYDEAGNKLWEKQFDGTVLVAHTVYALNENGENHPVWSEVYYDDDTWSRNEYDANGNCIKAYSFAADGAIDSETTMEYALDEDGWYYQTKEVTLMEGATFITQYNRYGDSISFYLEEADGTVVFNSTREYEYVDGEKAVVRYYDNGVLTSESFYEDGYGPVKEIIYLEDGTTEVYLYDEDGNTYDENGNLLTFDEEEDMEE